MNKEPVILYQMLIINMADSDDIGDCGCEYLDRNSRENVGNHCKNCDKRKIKYKKTVDELKSAQLIIEVLQTKANNNNGVCANKEAKDNKYMNKRDEVCVENSDVYSDLMNLNGNINDENLIDI
jgi:hypothetical protein